MTHTPLTYRDAGVDIDAGNDVVERIKPLVKRSFRPEVMGGLGGFGALFDLSGKYKEPVLVSGTDGVGTKLKLAQQLNRHDTIGIDLVAMCVNDVLVQGAEPLFFLDYFATGKLDVDTTVAVVGGIAKGCEMSGCALIGGETAEMPDMYPPGEYDLAGFCVAGVEKSKILDGAKVRQGDVLIGIASSGPHSNGYSLIRKIYDRAGRPADLDLGGTTLVDALMAPTRLYVKPILELLAGPHGDDIHAMAHITGGGLTENIIRVVPEGLGLDDRRVVMAAAAGVPVVAARRRGAARRDVAHLQLRHRFRVDRAAKRSLCAAKANSIAWRCRIGGSAKSSPLRATNACGSVERSPLESNPTHRIRAYGRDLRDHLDRPALAGGARAAQFAHGSRFDLATAARSTLADAHGRFHRDLRVHRRALRRPRAGCIRTCRTTVGSSPSPVGRRRRHSAGSAIISTD